MGNSKMSVTKNWGDGKFWTEAVFDAYRTTEQTWTDAVNDNLDQLKADILPSGYTFDDDGSGNLTNTIFDKQTDTDTYNSDISLGTSTDSDYTDVDATNAALVFTPEHAGNFRVTFQFPYEVASNTNTALSVTCEFRLTDGTNNSTPVRVVYVAGAVAATDVTFSNVVTVSHIFNLAASSQTLKLQRKITTATNIQYQRVTGASSAYGLYMSSEKI